MKCKHKRTKLIYSANIVTAVWCRDCGAVKDQNPRLTRYKWEAPEVTKYYFRSFQTTEEAL